MYTKNDREISTQPSCVDGEEAILGGILLDPNALVRIKDILVPEAFYIYAHSTIYKAALALYSQDKPVDLISVTTWLYDREQLERVGGQSFLAQLVSRTVSTVNIDALAELVMEKFTRRQLIALGGEIAQAAYSPIDDIDTILDQAQAKIFELRRRATEQEIEQISSIVPRVFSEVEQLNQGDEAISAFLPTGFYDLDAIAYGLPIGYPTILAGRPGTGKTTLGIELALHTAVNGLPVAFFSLEMSREDITKKIIARMSAPELKVENLFAQNSMPPDGWVTLSNSVVSALQLPIWINDKSTMTPADIRSDLRLIQSQVGELGLVVIDYIGLMKSNHIKPGNQVLEIDDILRELRAIAKDFKVALLGLAQINRGVEGRQDKRPTLSDIRGSGGYENEGALVLTLYNDAYYNANSPDQGIVELAVIKARFAKTGLVKVLFQPEYGIFKNLASTRYPN